MTDGQKTVYSISQDISSGTLDVGKLQSEILAANCVSNLSGILSEGDVLTILCDSVSNQSTLNSVIQNHVAVSLDDNKAAKILAIDSKTRDIIAKGFAYDGQQFSLSMQAQTNWLGLATLQSLLTFPIGITTAANTTYTLDQANVMAFIAQGVQVIKDAVGSGRFLKIAVNAAQTQVDLDAVVDKR